MLDASYLPVKRVQRMRSKAEERPRNTRVKSISWHIVVLHDGLI